MVNLDHTIGSKDLPKEAHKAFKPKHVKKEKKEEVKEEKKHEVKEEKKVEKADDANKQAADDLFGDDDSTPVAPVQKP